MSDNRKYACILLILDFLKESIFIFIFKTKNEKRIFFGFWFLFLKGKTNVSFGARIRIDSVHGLYTDYHRLSQIITAVKKFTI